jgi:molybdenum cofactor cytidylyltransferase
MMPAIVLAAGLSARFGGNKLLARIGDKPMILRVLENALSARLSPIILVTGFEQDRLLVAISPLIGNPRLLVTYNPDYPTGRASSVREGLRALPQSASAVMFLLGDQPFIDGPFINRLIDFAEAHPSKSVIFPEYAGRKGNPIIYRRPWFERLASLKGDVTGYRWIQEYPEEVARLPASDPSIFISIETREDYERHAGNYA